jgi:hypothetical protein
MLGVASLLKTMLPSLARLAPTASPYGRPATGMSDVQL